MDSIYFNDPLGLLIELASYRFEPPAGHTHADVLLEAHRIRVERERLQHRPRAPGGRDRGARGAIARVAVADLGGVRGLWVGRCRFAAAARGA